jgi:transcription elongation regulator 1
MNLGPTKGWIQSVAPTGKIYYFNTITSESTWEKPDDFNPPAPPPKPGMEIVAEMKLVPGTEWAICLTTKRHEFFYNKQNQFTSWEIPHDITNVLGKLLNKAMGIEEEESSEEEESEQDETEQVDVGEETNDASEEERMKLKRTADEMDEGDIREPEEVMPNIAKTDATQEVSKVEEVSPSAPTISLEERAMHFTNLLLEHKVSPFSAWAIEEPKLSTDPRFIQIPTPKERKSLFDKYCHVQSQKFLEERKLKSNDARDVYVELLNEVVNARTKYDDFVT